MDPEVARSLGRAPHGGADDPDLIDFSANVNPERPAGVEAVFRESLAATGRYPPEPPAEYIEAAAVAVGCDPAAVVPTAGATEAIRLAVETAIEGGDSVLLPAPSYAEYAREARLQGADPTFVDEAAVLGADPGPHALAVVCNPNNPTGRAYDDGALREFAARCRRAGTQLLVDEAFLGFTDRPSMAGEPGTVVVRSLTKLYGLPGLRAGYAVATGDPLEAMAAARPPWNVSTPARQVGAHCLANDGFVSETRERVARERERVAAGLSERFDVWPSEAPFLLLEIEGLEAAEVVRAARERGVAIRDATTFRGLDRHVRVAVRLPAENDRLLEVLGDV